MDKDKKYSKYLKGLKKATDEVKKDRETRYGKKKKPLLRDYIINLDIEQYDNGGEVRGGGAAIQGLNFKGVK